MPVMHYWWPHRSPRGSSGYYEIVGYVVACTNTWGDLKGRSFNEHRTDGFAVGQFTSVRKDVTCSKCKRSRMFKAAEAYVRFLDVEEERERVNKLTDAYWTVTCDSDDRNERRRFKRKFDKAHEEYSALLKEREALLALDVFNWGGNCDGRDGPKGWTDGFIADEWFDKDKAGKSGKAI